MNYLILLSIGLRVVGVRVVLEELSHICHDGFLIWFVYIHIYRATHTSNAHLMVLYTKKLADLNTGCKCFYRHLKVISALM